MIYDCFNFYNEFELLDIRLNELDSVVDKFILVESTVTFTNKKKPLYFSENKKRYKKFLHKIIHVVIDDSPNVTNPWIIEAHQLGGVVRGLPKNTKPNDIVLVSCVDEIPKPEAILKWKNKPGRHKVFMQALSYYYINFIRNDNELWSGTMMFKYKDLKYFPSVYVARFMPPDLKISDGGWHMSYVGGIKKIQQKLTSFSHQEYNNDKYNTPERIKQAMLEGRDPFGYGWKFKIADPDSLPKYVIKNKKKFSYVLLEEYANNKFNSINAYRLELMHLLRVSILRNIKRKIT